LPAAGATVHLSTAVVTAGVATTRVLITVSRIEAYYIAMHSRPTQTATGVAAAEPTASQTSFPILIIATPIVDWLAGLHLLFYAWPI